MNNHHCPMVFLWVSYGFPMVFLWISYGFYDQTSLLHPIRSSCTLYGGGLNGLDVDPEDVPDPVPRIVKHMESG